MKTYDWVLFETLELPFRLFFCKFKISLEYLSRCWPIL